VRSENIMDRRTVAFCTKAIRQIDPGYAGPIYLLEPRQARDAVSQGDYAGATRFALSGDVREFLQRHRLWSGPGFCAVLDLDKIHSTLELLSVVLHEYCHHVQGVAQTTRLQDVIGVEQFYRVISEPSDRVQAGIPPEPVSSAAAELREMHDATFIRLAIHANSGRHGAANSYASSTRACTAGRHGSRLLANLETNPSAC
jgi:hypothetical protein